MMQGQLGVQMLVVSLSHLCTTPEISPVGSQSSIPCAPPTLTLWAVLKGSFQIPLQVETHSTEKRNLLINPSC